MEKVITILGIIVIICAFFVTISAAVLMAKIAYDLILEFRDKLRREQ